MFVSGPGSAVTLTCEETAAEPKGKPLTDKPRDERPEQPLMTSSADAGVPLAPEPASAGPGHRRGIWTAEREELLCALESQDNTCAKLYREAVDAVGAPTLDIGKLVVAGHAVRELVNLLPAVLADVELPERVRDEELLSDLVNSWSVYQAEVPRGEGAYRLVPADVVQAANAFVRAQRQISENAQARRAALVLGNTQATNDSSVAVVVRAVRVFERSRHPSPGAAASESDRAVYHHALSVIEHAIAGRIVGFFTVKRSIDEVAAAANVRTDDGTWRVPTEEEVAATLARIGGFQLRRIFYDRLANPEWIPLLDQHGALRRPPAPEAAEAQIWQPWPAGDYLVRMAPERPSEVRAILQRLVDDHASWHAKTKVLDAALAMPAEEARPMAAFIQRQLSGELDPGTGLDVVTFIERLAAVGDCRPAMRLAQALLRPRAVERNDGSGQRVVRAGIDAYWYAEALQRVVVALASDPRILPTVYAWLREQQVTSDSWEPDQEWDVSSVWRPSISDHAQNHLHYDIADALVDALRNLTLQQLESAADLEGTLAVLERDHLPVAMRIALYALSEQVGHREDALAIATERLLDRELLHDPWLHREYCQLATATLSKLTDAQFERWASLVDAGPQLSDARLQRVEERLEPGQTVEQALSEHATYWRHELLSAVGESALRGRLREEHQALVAALGEIAHAGFRSWTWVSWGDETPLTAAQLSEMSPAEVVETLSTWHPDAASRSTKDGLADALREAVEAKPADFVAVADQLLALGEPYRSRFLDAVRKVSESSDVIDWHTFLQAVDGLYATVELIDDRAKYACRQVCSAIENATSGEHSRIPAHLLSTAARIVAAFLTDPEPSDGDNYGSDHLGKALNSLRPVALRTLIRIARAAKLADATDDVVPEVLKALEGCLVPRDESLAVAASFGESLSLLMWLDSGWVRQRIPAMTTADPFGDVVLTTALTTNRTSQPLVDDLWGAIDSVLDRLADDRRVELGWRSDRSVAESIGDHLMTLLMWGVASPWPERVASFYSRVSSETVASVLGHVGWRLVHTDAPSSELLVRASAIWDERQAAVDAGLADAAQLAQFYWWVHSNKFPVSWWLPRLSHVADLIDFEGRSFVGEHLEASAQEFPGETIALIARLLQNDAHTLARHGLVRASPRVIARGLLSGTASVRQAARGLMDKLGEQGIVDMDIQVARAAAELDHLGLRSISST